MAAIGAMIRRDVHPHDLVGHARAIEALFDELWIVEDLPYAGGISQAAAVLASTATVTVGHGIAPAPFRNPTALAMEWATLAEAFPGRFKAAIGHGVQDWMRSIGEQVESPLTLLRETTVAVTALLNGGTVNQSGRYTTLDNITLEYPPTRPPTVALGVSGPRSLELAGEIASGTVLPEGHGPDEVWDARERITAGARRAQHRGSHHMTVFAGCHIGSTATMAPRNPAAPVGWEAVGPTPDAVARKLRDLIDADVDTIVLVPLGQDLEHDMHALGTQVVPQLR